MGHDGGANPLWLRGHVAAGLGGVPRAQLPDQGVIRPASDGASADATDRRQSSHQRGAAVQTRREHQRSRPRTRRQPHRKVIKLLNLHIFLKKNFGIFLYFYFRSVVVATVSYSGEPAVVDIAEMQQRLMANQTATLITKEVIVS